MKSMIRVFAALLAVTLAPHLFAADAFEVRPNTNVDAMVSLNGRLHFLGAVDAQYGLWTTDGTAAGTLLVNGLAAASGPSALEVCAGQLFANAGGTLWRSDGTNAGTAPLASQVTAIACAGRTLYFAGRANLSAPWQLWRTDGTAANTLLIAEFSGQLTNLTSVRGTLFFVADERTVYVTDGTSAGTRAAAVATPPITGMIAMGARAIYATGSELRSTDGTASAALLLDQGSALRPPFATGSRAMYFRDGVWQTDGTAAATIVRWPLRGSSLPLFGAASGRFFFKGSPLASSVDALWVSDGTNAGTRQLAAIADASSLSEGGGLLFVGSGTGTSVTDGTSTPAAIATLWPGGATAAGSRVYLRMFSSGPASPGTRSTHLYAYDLAFSASSLAPDVVSMSGGTAVTITGTGLDGATTVTVDGVAMTITSRSATSLTFNAPAHARATAEVVVTSGSGQQARFANALTFTCDTLPVAVAGGSAATCALQPVPLTGSGGVACSWLPAAGLSDATSCTPSAAPAATTTYRLIVTNASGCASTNAADVTVTVRPTPLATITVSPSSLYGRDSTASVPDSGAGITYQWTATNAQIVSDPAQRTITFRLGCDRATLNVTVTGANGCAVSRSVPVVPAYSTTFTSATPATARPGTVVTIAGRGFTCVTGVRFGLDTFASSFHVDSDTQISATFPPYTTGGAVGVRIDGTWIRTGLFVTLPPVVKRADFDGDGRNDLVFRDPLSGLDAIWLMNGTAYKSTVNIVGFPQPDYHIVGAADFDGDGSVDLLLHNLMNGANAIWKMSKLKYVTTFDLPAIADPSYVLEGTGDFNADGKPDILVRNRMTGANAVWVMNGMTVQSTVNLPPLPNSNYRMYGTADFNGDGKPDIVWRDRSSGANAVWLMNGVTLDAVLNLPPLPNSDYDIGAVADYNDDNKPDLVWRNRITGANAIWLLDGASLLGVVDLPPVVMQELEMAGPR